MFAVLVYTLILLVLLQIFLFYKSNVNKFKSIDIFPGPSPWEFLKTFVGSKSIKEKYNFIINLNAKYGPIAKIWVKPMNPVLQVTDVRLIEKILLSKDHLERTATYEVWRPYWGDCLAITKSTELWKRMRKILNPSLSPAHLEKHSFPIFLKYTEAFIETLKNKTRQKLDIQPLSHLITLDMIFEAVTGHKTNFLKNENNTYLDARINYCNILAMRIYNPIYMIDFIFRKTKYFNRMIQTLRVMKNFSRTIVEERSKENKNENTLDVMTKSDLEKELIVANVDLLLLAGHDTVAAAISYACFEIASRPDVQRKILRELKDIRDELNEPKLTPNVLNRMKYLESVVKEAMRLHNVVPFIERVVGVDVVFDGVTIPKGTNVACNFYGVHLSEEYFENPREFVADRFVPENSRKIAPNTFLALSIGPKDCIGRYYAFLVIKCVIAKLVMEFELLPVVPKHEMDIVGELVSTSTNGVPIVLKERNGDK